MNRKRFIKLLMSCGVGRNQAVRLAELMRAARYPYLEAWIFCLEQMKMLFCCADDVHSMRRRKVERLKERLDNAPNVL